MTTQNISQGQFNPAQFNPVQFNPAQFKAGFVRSLISEFMKFNSRAIIVTAGLAFFFYTVIVYMVSDPEWNQAEITGAHITDGWQFLTLFFIVIGAMSVTVEYSHTTMRTTMMSDPRRSRVFVAKIVAVAGFSALLLLAIIIGAWFAMTIRHGNVNFFGDGVLPIAMFAFVLITIAVMSAGLGYIVRSTAGAISLMTAFTLLSDTFVLIPGTFFREIFPQFTPYALGTAAIADAPIVPGDSVIILNSWHAAGTLGLYATIIAALGWLLFARRDA